jgi:hypothetical protein
MNGDMYARLTAWLTGPVSSQDDRPRQVVLGEVLRSITLRLPCGRTPYEVYEGYTVAELCEVAGYIQDEIEKSFFKGLGVGLGVALVLEVLCLTLNGEGFQFMSRDVNEPPASMLEVHNFSAAMCQTLRKMEEDGRKCEDCPD